MGRAPAHVSSPTFKMVLYGMAGMPCIGQAWWDGAAAVSEWWRQSGGGRGDGGRAGGRGTWQRRRAPPPAEERVRPWSLRGPPRGQDLGISARTGGWGWAGTRRGQRSGRFGRFLSDDSQGRMVGPMRKRCSRVTNPGNQGGGRQLTHLPARFRGLLTPPASPPTLLAAPAPHDHFVLLQCESSDESALWMTRPCTVRGV